MRMLSDGHPAKPSAYMARNSFETCDQATGKNQKVQKDLMPKNETCTMEDVVLLAEFCFRRLCVLTHREHAWIPRRTPSSSRRTCFLPLIASHLGLVFDAQILGLRAAACSSLSTHRITPRWTACASFAFIRLCFCAGLLLAPVPIQKCCAGLTFRLLGSHYIGSIRQPASNQTCF